MLDKLFSSQARIEVLKLLLFNPKNRYYQRQIANFTNQSIRAVQREVEKLEAINLIKKSIEGKNIFYQINEQAIIFDELKRIFIKTVGIAKELKENLKNSQSMKIAFIYGSYATGKEEMTSDIDLFILGDITSKEVSSILSKPKRELNREINYLVMKEKEFIEKIKAKNHFIVSLIKEKKIFLIGNEDEFRKIIKSR